MDNEELFVGCVNGETQAQGLLYEKYNKHLFNICLKYIGNEYDAKDCLQDGFLHIFNKLQKMDSNSNIKLDAWLSVVMRNYTLDVLRKRKKDKTVEYVEYFTSEIIDDEEFVVSISHNTLLELIETLTPQFKKVFKMYAIDELSHKDIAKELNISESTSKTNYHRARKKLKKSLFSLDIIN
jgi:RNA polymerase sigma factor (sigma-70 family)